MSDFSDAITWMVQALIDALLYPIQFIVGLALYEVFVKNLLKTLNALENVFFYVVGSNVEQLLFKTSLSNGEVNYNFFTSDSPLKSLFLISASIGASFVTIFITINVIVTVYNFKNVNIMKKIATTFGSGSFIFFLPVAFLLLLSLCTTFLSLLTLDNNKNGPSEADITAKYSKTIDRLADLKVGLHPDDLNKHWLSRTKKYSGNFFRVTKKSEIDPKTLQPKFTYEIKLVKNTQYNLNEIYNDFNEYDFLDNDLKSLINENKKLFVGIQNAILTVPNVKDGQVLLNNNLNNRIDDIQEVISSLKPDQKDNVKSDKIKEANYLFYDIQKRIRNYKKNSDKILSVNYYDSRHLEQLASKNAVKQTHFLNNFKFLYSQFFGEAPITKEVTNINSMSSLNTFLTFLIEDAKNGGTLYLERSLSTIKSSPLAETFYELMTGNKDGAWENSSYTDVDTENATMLFFGFCLTVATCFLLVIMILFAMIRIMDLALLFVVSPIPVFVSALDDGARMQIWLKYVMGEMICIFGMLITLKLVGPVSAGFQSLMDSSPQVFQGNFGSTMKLVLKGLIYFAGILASYQASIKLSAVFGVGEGVTMNLMNTMALGALQTAGSKTAGGAGSILKAGPSAIFGTRKSKSNKGNQKNQKNPQNQKPNKKQNWNIFKKSHRKGFTDTWKKRKEKYTEAASLIPNKSLREKVTSRKQRTIYNKKKNANLAKQNERLEDTINLDKDKQ